MTVGKNRLRAKTAVLRKRRLATMDQRVAFWNYCIKTTYRAQERARKRGVPCRIDAHFVEELLVAQDWKCAVTGLPLDSPETMYGERKNTQLPFTPSLDRIVPSLGYVPGNVRVVSNIVNNAMSDWGLETLLVVAKALVKTANKKTARTPVERGRAEDAQTETNSPMISVGRSHGEEE